MRDQLSGLTEQMYSSGIFFPEAVREFSKSFITAALLANRGNQCAAARDLHMHRNTLSRKMGELKIDARSMRIESRKKPVVHVVLPEMARMA